MKFLIFIFIAYFTLVSSQPGEVRGMSSELSNIIDHVYQNKEKWLMVVPDLDKYEKNIREMAGKEEPTYNCFDDIDQAHMDSLSENLAEYKKYLKSQIGTQFVVGETSIDHKIDGFDLHFAPTYAKDKAFYFGHKSTVKCESAPRTRLLLRSLIVYFL